MEMKINIAQGVDLSAQDVITGRGCIIGQSGSGKSYLVGVIVEELCRNSLPFLIIDTEGEYRSLKSVFNVLWAGEDKKADVGMDVDFRKLFAESISNRVPVIFDVSDSIDKIGTVYRALEAVYSVEEEKRSPYLVVIEEADKFAPQIVRPKANPVEEISVRGRKRGIGLLVATQRPANVSKNVLAQCSYGFVGKLSIENDLKAVGILFENRKAVESITELNTGTFMPFGLPLKAEVQVKKRTVLHVGATPSIDELKQKNTRISSILKELRGTSPGIASGTPQRQKPKPLQTAEVITPRFTIDMAQERAKQLLKRQILPFSESEKVESVVQRYLEVTLCNIRIPTRSKNEYSDNFVMVNGRQLVNLKKKISFENPEAVKPSRFAEMRGGFPTERSNVEVSAAINHSPVATRNAKRLMAMLFPDSRILSVDNLYIPLYEITLRRGSRVRVFKIDGLYGRRLENV